MMTVIFRNIFLWVLFFLTQALAANEQPGSNQNRPMTCASNVAYSLEAKRYFHKKQYLLSAIHFKSASLLSCDEQNQLQNLFYYTLAMQNLGESSEVIDQLSYLDQNAVGNLKKNVQLFKNHYLHIENESSLESHQRQRLQEWDQRQIKPDHPKSVVLAGSLSAFIPGAGQAYVGTWQSAAYSFLLNALFLSAATELDRKELKATSLAAWTVFSVTYVGGILSATESAQIYNARQTAQQESELHQKLFPEFYP